MSDIHEIPSLQTVIPNRAPTFATKSVGASPPRSKREVAAFENNSKRLAVATARSDCTVRRRVTRWKR